MALRLIGSGFGRTGTNSLKLALEQLLGEPCYHMIEVFGHPEHVPILHAATRNEPVDWDVVFEGYAAAVDLPTSAFWPEIAARYPEAVILHSTRDAEAWWKSASSTIFLAMEKAPPGQDAWWEMMMDLLGSRFTRRIDDHDACVAAFEAWDGWVRREAPADRLVEWRPGDGWEPLAQALGVAVPDAEFPHVNSTEDFRKNMGLAP